MLLKNGWKSPGKNATQTALTCSFDSLYFVVAAMYADYDNVKRQIDKLTQTCTFSKMVKTMFDPIDSSAAKHRSLHQQRNEILHKILEYRQLQFGSGLTYVKCDANVNFMIPKALSMNLYSYSRTKQCNRCDQKIISNRCFVDINFEEFENLSIKYLNSCLLETIISEQPSFCSCDGGQMAQMMISKTEFSNFIMIDLHLKSTIREIALNDIPKKLSLLGETFSLTACIEFIGEMPEDFDSSENGSAHHVAHILRSNKQWQTYDDLKSQMFPSKINSKIKGQVLFYVKINDA